MVTAKRIGFIRAGIIEHVIIAVAAVSVAHGAESAPSPSPTDYTQQGAGRLTTHPQSAAGSNPSSSLAIPYDVIDGWVVIDGDMVVGRIDESETARTTASLSAEARPIVRRDVATMPEIGLWPNNTVPYVIPAETPTSDRVAIQDAIRAWNDRTILRFVERTTERDYLKFVAGVGGACRAQLGFVGGEQYVWNCAWMHEIGHAVGLIHEHQRSDRDNYLMYSPGLSERFSHRLIGSSVNHAHFDYRSVMKYGLAPTIPPGIAGGGDGFGRGYGHPSPGVIHGVAKLYGEPPKAFEISTNPPGGEVVVDGVRHVTPVRFDWPVGSSHRIEAPLLQMSPERWDRYVFARWGDDGNCVRNLTVRPDETWIEANYIYLTNSLRRSGHVALTSRFNWPRREFDAHYGSPRALTLVSSPSLDSVTDVIRLVNRGDASVRYVIRTDRPWLSTSLASASVAPGERVDLEVTATRAGLRADLHHGDLTITRDGHEETGFESVRVWFVVLPAPTTVRLGSSGQSIQVAVSSTEGLLGMDGRPLENGGRVTIANGDTYALVRTANGIIATPELRSQSLVLADGSALTLQQDGSMNWRIGSDRVYPGYRHVQEGLESSLELVDGRWRAASHAIRSVLTPDVNIHGGLGPMALDEGGNAYFLSEHSSQVFRLNVHSGLLAVVAGVGGGGFEGDGGPAVNARLGYPQGVAVDAASNIYVADTYNHRIRRIDGSTGEITTFAGSGPVSEYGAGRAGGFEGDGGPAVNARLSYPKGVAVDAAGNVYVADAGNSRIRKIEASSGVISTLAGGVATHLWDGGPATLANLRSPEGIAVDESGNVYVADTYNHRIRKIDGSGTINTLAQLRLVRDLAVSAAGDVYAVAGFRDRVIWRVDPQGGPAELIAGAGTQTLASEWELSGSLRLRATGVAADREGRVWFWDNVSSSLGVMEKLPIPFRSTGTLNSAPYSIRSVAGGTAIPDGESAASTTFCYPSGIAVDAVGNVFAADTRNQRVRKIDVSGVVSTLAGTGNWGYSGDGGPASEAQLYLNYQLFGGLALDGTGNLFVADNGNNRLRKIDALTANITTVAGTGRRGFRGDGWPARGARLDSPQGVAVDLSGNLYVSDSGNHRVRKIDTLTGVISTVAGGGQWTLSSRANLGDGGPASEALLSSPSGVALDATDSVYVADSGHNRVRKIDAASGMISTIAEVRRPIGVAVDLAGNVYVAYYRGLRKIDAASGAISTLEATNSSSGVAVDSAGNVFLSDHYRIHRIEAASGVTSQFAGSNNDTCGFAGGVAEEARFFSPASIAIGGAGEVFLTDSNRVWKLDATGIVSILAGTGERTWYSDVKLGDGGPATEATFHDPVGVAVDAAGNVYVADTGNHRIRRIDTSTGMISTVAGTGEPTSYRDATSYADVNVGDGGPATEATFISPVGVAVDVAGNVYVADTGNRRIRRIDTSTGMISTVAGTGEPTAYTGVNLGDGGPATGATFDDPVGVAVDTAGNVYVADRGNNLVRRISVLTGNIKAIVSAREITSVATDPSGNVYVGAGNQIRMVDGNGGVRVIAGTGSSGFSGDGENAAGAGLSVSGIAVDRFGAVWFTDPKSRRIRILDP